MISGVLGSNDQFFALTAVNDELKIIYDYLTEKEAIDVVPAGERLWLKGAMARFLLHGLLGKNDGIRDLEEVDFKTVVFDDIELDIVESSANLEFLFRYVYHPDYESSDGLVVGFSTQWDKEQFLENLKAALTIIKNVDAAAYEMLRTSLKCVCPVYTVSPLKKGDVISFSADYSYGMVVFSPCPQILMAETLIHETRHNVLFSVLKYKSLVVDSELRVQTPLREDPRPILGLLHQAYVLCGLVGFFENLLLRSPFMDMENVKKRFALHQRDLQDSIAVLDTHRAHLTIDGQSLLSEMLAYSNNHV